MVRVVGFGRKTDDGRMLNFPNNIIKIAINLCKF